MSFLNRLKERWKLNNLFQVIIVLVVFACTGFTVMFLKRPVLGWIGTNEEYSLFFSVLYYFFILPIYFGLLLIYGFIFGQYHFFRRFISKTWDGITGKKNKG